MLPVPKTTAWLKPMTMLVSRRISVASSTGLKLVTTGTMVSMICAVPAGMLPICETLSTASIFSVINITPSTLGAGATTSV